MHPDVVKLVESGRIPQSVGDRVSQLAPGSFCLHKAGGSGKVTDWDLFGGKVTIDFEKESARVMGLKLALEKTAGTTLVSKKKKRARVANNMSEEARNKAAGG